MEHPLSRKCHPKTKIIQHPLNQTRKTSLQAILIKNLSLLPELTRTQNQTN